VRLLTGGIGKSHGTVEFVFYCDDDDPELERITAVIKAAPDAVQITGPRITLSQMWNECYAQSHGEIVMQCGDDIVFRTEGWDTLVYRAFSEYPDGIVLVYGNDCFQGEQLATHGFVTRRWADTVGHFTPKHFSSDYGDQWLFDVARGIGRTHYIPELVTEHLHPAAGKAAWDLTHQDRLARHRQDDVGTLYASLAGERQADMDKLRSVME
jgi:glycosyl transferase/beta-hydroxylase protein BlmF